MKKLRFLIIGGLLIAVFGWKFAPAVRAKPSTNINLSAYEFLLGTACTINEQAGQCGVSFGGWTGGTGPVPTGWTPFPGTKQGLWEATINYTGSPAFGGSVTVQSGTFDLFLKGEPPLSGEVITGGVTWPANASTDIGCGVGVARVVVAVSTESDGTLNFNGCLHDLPAGSEIPPRLWGAFGSGVGPCVASGSVKPDC